MIILIGGESHTGKTLLAQKLLEKYKIPYTSLDHVKMGLIRGYADCGFTPYDNDNAISQKMWGLIKGIIDTCHENKQNIILEGCYLPPDKVKSLVCKDVVAIYLGFSEEYIRNNFDKIIAFESLIEQRKFPEARTESDFILENLALNKRCTEAGLPYFEIKEDYVSDLCMVYDFIHSKILKLREYKQTDIDEITQLFYETIHAINAKDYEKNQLDVWATGQLDKDTWNNSLSKHYTIVAEIGGKIVGFGDLDNAYLDRLFVHKDYQRLGIATAITEKLEQEATNNGQTTITTHASITAKPFFDKRNYNEIREQQVERSGVLLTNFVMEKQLGKGF